MLFQEPAAPSFSAGALVVIDPAQPNRLFVAPTTFDSGTSTLNQRFLGSIDWGVTWSDIPPPAGSALVTALAIDTESTISAVASASNGLMWRSADGEVAGRRLRCPPGPMGNHHSWRTEAHLCTW